MKRLTPKQTKFINVYLETGNASEAYRRTYSCERMKDATINRKAVELLRNGKITARIEELQRELRKLSDITKEEVLSELASILRAKITDYLHFNGFQIAFKSFEDLTEPQIKAIESIKENRHGEIELKLHGKNWTIDRICKILGFDSAQDFNVNLEKLDESAIDSIIERLIPKN